MPVRFFLVFARIVVKLKTVVGIELDLAVGLHDQAVAGSLEIVVVLRPLTGAHFVLVFPGNDLAQRAQAADRPPHDDLFLLGVDIRLGVVTQNEGMLPLLMLEVIEDAFVLEQTRNEIEVGLAILHAVFPGRRCSLKLGRERNPGQDLLDDVGDRLILKNPTIGSPREKPKHGHYLSPIHAEPVAGSLKGKAIDVTVEVSIAAVSVFDPKRDILADDFVGLDVVSRGEQLRDRS